MIQMAKSANSKVIFLPATNQTVTQSMQEMTSGSNGEGSSSPHPRAMVQQGGADNEYGTGNPGFQSAINSAIIEHM